MRGGSVCRCRCKDVRVYACATPHACNTNSQLRGRLETQACRKGGGDGVRVCHNNDTYMTPTPLHCNSARLKVWRKHLPSPERKRTVFWISKDCAVEFIDGLLPGNKARRGFYLVSAASSDEGGGALSGSSGNNVRALDRHREANSNVADGMAADDSAL